MSKFKLKNPIEHKPSISLNKIEANEYRAKLTQAWKWQTIDLDDGWYFYPTWEDWDKIFQYVQKSLPGYASDAFDCDNFAFYVSVLVSKEFSCNTCNVVEGNVNFQDGRGWIRHKWNVFFDGESFYQLESQKYTPPDKIADLSDSNYIPDEIIAF